MAVKWEQVTKGIVSETIRIKIPVQDMAEGAQERATLQGVLITEGSMTASYLTFGVPLHMLQCTRLQTLKDFITTRRDNKLELDLMITDRLV